uniref:Uncharacterized protein n=1 Tax=Zosterops lateralis melanops TaxID=1220523 RepID=A0A8D2PB60_ZOSLA
VAWRRLCGVSGSPTDTLSPLQARSPTTAPGKDVAGNFTQGTGRSSATSASGLSPAPTTSLST